MSTRRSGARDPPTCTVAGRGQPRPQAGGLQGLWGAVLRPSSLASGCVSVPPHRRFSGAGRSAPVCFPSASSFLGYVWLPGPGGSWVFSDLGSLAIRQSSVCCRVSAVFRAVPRRVLWGTGRPAVLTATSSAQLHPASPALWSCLAPRPWLLPPSARGAWPLRLPDAHVLVPAPLCTLLPGGSVLSCCAARRGCFAAGQPPCLCHGTRLGRMPLTCGDLAPGRWAAWGCRILS